MDFKVKHPVNIYISEWLETRPDINSSEYSYAEPNLVSHYKGLCQYGKPHPEIDRVAWDFMKECVNREYFPKMCNSRIVDAETVISQMDKKTSNGTFLKLCFKNKGDFFKHPLSREYLQDYWDRLKHKEKIIHCFRQMSDKYEVRPTEKLKLNKVRVFTADETCSVVASGRFSLHMNNKFYMNSTKFSSVVGRSKFYAGFQLFFEMVKKFKMTMASTDVSGMDTVQWFLLQVEQMMFRWDCLCLDDQTPDNWLRFSNYFLTTIMSFLHAIDGNVYFKQFGVCSGFGNTLVDNTINLFRVWTYVFARCWLNFYKDTQFVSDALTAVYLTSPVDSKQRAAVRLLQQEHEANVLSYDYMNQNLLMLLTGDDNTHGVNPAITEWFNINTVCVEFKKIGMVMNYEHVLYVSIDEVSFLSQRWVKLDKDGIYLPSPEYGKVLGSLIHGCKSPDLRWALLRAYALRIESWANLKARKDIQDFISFLHSTYGEQLQGSMIIPNTDQPITMSQIESVYLTADQLDQLYTGQESSGSGGIITEVLKLLTQVDMFTFSTFLDTTY